MISRIHHEAENASNKVRTMGKRSQGLGTGAKKSFTVSRSLIVRRKKISSFRMSFEAGSTQSTCQRDCTLEDVHGSRPRRIFPTKCFLFCVFSNLSRAEFSAEFSLRHDFIRLHRDGLSKTTGREMLDQKESTMSRVADSRRCGVRATMVLYRISSDSTEKKKARTG